jgi:predicted acetyltransferase
VGDWMIEVVPVREDEKLILSHLLELYHNEFSDYEGTDVNALGLYGYSYLDYYWTEERRFAYFIKVDGKLAGFAMVCNHCYVSKDPSTNFMAEFFVMRKYRRRGIGKQVAQDVIKRHPGKWELTVHLDNHPSHPFWEQVIQSVCESYEVIQDIENVYERALARAYLFSVS